MLGAYCPVIRVSCPGKRSRALPRQISLPAEPAFDPLEERGFFRRYRAAAPVLALVVFAAGADEKEQVAGDQSRVTQAIGRGHGGWLFPLALSPPL